MEQPLGGQASGRRQALRGDHRGGSNICSRGGSRGKGEGAARAGDTISESTSETSTFGNTGGRRRSQTESYMLAGFSIGYNKIKGDRELRKVVWVSD